MKNELTQNQELDLSVFQVAFDPHNRGRQCVTVLTQIQANEPKKTNHVRKRGENPLAGKTLSPENQRWLLVFARHMIERIRENELSLASFEKNMAESWNFALSMGETDVSKADVPQIEAWWAGHKERFQRKEIGWGSLQKYRDCVVSFLQVVEGLPLKETPARMKTIRLPKKPKNGMQDQMPTGEQIKKFIEAVRVAGKTYTIRDQAVLMLAYDSGARIGEILSMRNCDIKPEGEYLMVSFPESKSMPRTVISFLAKSVLEEWSKVSPNRTKGKDAPFFCQADGKGVQYAAVNKSFRRALAVTSIPWKKSKAAHFFRAIAASRFFTWPYVLRNSWFGWQFKTMESAYTTVDYRAFVKPYFETLQAENNPFLKGEVPHWNNPEAIDRQGLERLMQNDVFRTALMAAMKEIARK